MLLLLWEWFPHFLLFPVGVPGDKGERGSPGTGIRGQRGASGPQGNTTASFLYPQAEHIIAESPILMRRRHKHPGCFSPTVVMLSRLPLHWNTVSQWLLLLWNFLWPSFMQLHGLNYLQGPQTFDQNFFNLYSAYTVHIWNITNLMVCILMH